MLSGILLKRKEFVIQWRKYGLKRSSAFRVMNFLSLCPFFDFYLIFISFLLLKSRKKGIILPAR